MIRRDSPIDTGPRQKRQLKVALVGLPWSSIHRPSAAVGALAAYVRAHEPEYDVHCLYDYMNVADEIGLDVYDGISNDSYHVGEVLYCAILYPEKRAAVIALTARALAKSIPVVPPTPLVSSGTWEVVLERVCAALERHIERLAFETANRFDVVGLTTCFGQLFANLAYAKRLKEASPGTRIVLGGSTISGRVGPSILTTYSFVDAVVQGEGEEPFLHLLRAFESGNEALPDRGVLSRANVDRFPNGVPLWEVSNLDQLPVPTYDEYVELAARFGIEWILPLESSRGCWWDRVKTASNPKSTCYFCNLNVQWNGYREKSVARVAAELDELSERYANNNIFFLDNIIRHKGVGDLAAAIRRLGKEFSLFYEMRASIRPREILELWEAGLDSVQFGIESLSTSLLRRIGKGTSVLQNLEAMKTCYELGIQNGANLILDFPGATDEEVRETRDNILHYAICYGPLRQSSFNLGVGSTVETLRESFGVLNVRNDDRYLVGIPEGIARSLNLLDLSFDLASAPVDWSSVVAACEEWQALHTRLASGGMGRTTGPAPLSYRDGGSYLTVEDARWGRSRFVLRGLTRDIYMHCMQIRSFDKLAERFLDAEDEAGAEQLRSLLSYLVSEKLMFHEGKKYLSLAVAQNARSAARRIREASDEDSSPPRAATSRAPERRRLSLV